MNRRAGSAPWWQKVTLPYERGDFCAWCGMHREARVPSRPKPAPLPAIVDFAEIDATRDIVIVGLAKGGVLIGLDYRMLKMYEGPGARLEIMLDDEALQKIGCFGRR